MAKKINTEEALEAKVATMGGARGSISDRINEIHKDLLAGTDRVKKDCFGKPEDRTTYLGLYKYNSRLAAMAIAISEALCDELSESDPSEWVNEQTSREGNSRVKSDPKVKELSNFLELSGKLLDKCNAVAFRV